MAQEREIKLAVQSARAARALLSRAGFEVRVRRLFEANTLYDTPGQELRARNELVRIREVGRTVVVTYKGPPSPGRHKLREEIEYTASGAREAALIFERLGLRPIFRYEKYRTEFERKGERGAATLDETPIGVFLELEGPAAWIDRAARRMGFAEADYNTKSYGSLYLDYCKLLGQDPTNMVFPGRKKT